VAVLGIGNRGVEIGGSRVSGPQEATTRVNETRNQGSNQRYTEAKLAYIRYCKQMGYWGGDTAGLSVPGGSP